MDESTLRPAPVHRARRRFDWLPIWLILPAVCLMALLLFYPIGRGVHLSFFDVNLLQLSRGGTFVGLQNYTKLLRDPTFWNSLRVTVYYTVGVVSSAYLLGLVLALLLHQRFPARGMLRTCMIVPWAVPEVVASMMFVWILDAQYGVLNYFLLQLGLIQKPLAWLVEARLALPGVMIASVWKQFPLALLVLLAGLQTIPHEQYEAAMIDGANGWQRFRYVTLPGLRPINTVLVLIMILYSFRRVALLYVMTAGGPARSTETLAVLTYNVAFRYQELGYASTVGTLLLLMLLAFTLIYFRFVVRQENP